MTLHHADPWLTVHQGDWIDVLREMPAESVHCVVTSPPYWGLRDYGTATWVGGDEGCDHAAARRPIGNSPSAKSTLTTNNGRGPKPGDKFSAGSQSGYARSCSSCGAQRVDAQLGLEPTPEAYVARLVEGFREVRRVLRKDGTLWLNLGDSYANDTKWGGSSGGKHVPALHGQTGIGRQKVTTGLKPKDLVGIPWRVAFALQADGWVLRSDVVWSKPNPMPESVTDRPTKSHEMLFLFSKGKWVGPEPGRFVDVSDSDARWLAMFLDTEGSIVVKRSERVEGRTQYGIQVSFASTSSALLGTAQQIIGRGTILWRDGRNAPMGYYQFAWREARDLLHRVYPSLIVKARQARVGIAVQDRLNTLGQKRPGGFRAPALTEWLERAWQTMKSLNHFGDPDISWAPEPTYGRWMSQPYFYDADGVREPHLASSLARYELAPSTYATTHADVNVKGRRPANGVDHNPAGRNLRSVWTVATQPYAGAHFATFPRKLVEPCVKAGTSERGVCPECGAPWVRVVEHFAGDAEAAIRPKFKEQGGKATSTLSLSGNGSKEWAERGGKRQTTDWEPSCDCRNTTGQYADNGPLSPVPATVLDPFAGSGTTGLVANALSRRAVLIDLNTDYLDQAMTRNAQTPIGLVG